MLVVSLPKLEDPRHQALLEWMLTPHGVTPDPPTRELLASSLGVHRRTMKDWEAREDFKEAHRAYVMATATSPQKIQHVMDELYKDATTDGGKNRTAAQKVFLDKAMPNAVAPKGKGSTQDLSPEKLDELLKAMLQDELARRAAKEALKEVAHVED